MWVDGIGVGVTYQLSQLGREGVCYSCNQPVLSGTLMVVDKFV